MIPMKNKIFFRRKHFLVNMIDLYRLWQKFFSYEQRVTELFSSLSFFYVFLLWSLVQSLERMLKCYSHWFFFTSVGTNDMSIDQKITNKSILSPDRCATLSIDSFMRKFNIGIHRLHYIRWQFCCNEEWKRRNECPLICVCWYEVWGLDRITYCMPDASADFWQRCEKRNRC